MPDAVERPIPIAATWEQPTRLAAAWHACKRWGHVSLRTIANAIDGPTRIDRANTLVDAPIIAEHRSPLWLDGRADEFLLRCGKVQNLRVAIRRFDGIEVAAGRTLSFWSQLGRPSAARGFAVGREIVGGCVVPTIGGGLCQLSNALASIAATAGARFVERHRHSALIEQQRFSGDDATVAWNHIDLRIAADFDFRIEADLTHDELVLRLRAMRSPRSIVARAPLPPIRDDRRIARGCLTCDEKSCFRHRRHTGVTSGRVAVLVNDRNPELARWLETEASHADWMVPWVRPALRTQAWVVPAASRALIATWPSWKRIARQRLMRGEGAARQAGRMQTAADLAAHYARRLKPEHVELMVSQDLLVPLWRLGVLAGRSFDVYVPELPASELQSRLDAAAAGDPGAASLADYRVEASWQHDEWTALARARTLLTAHRDVHRVLRDAGLDAELLAWEDASPSPAATATRSGTIATDMDHRPTITLASSALPRKGSREVALVARALGARVLILGSPPGDPAAWHGIDWQAVGYGSNWIARSDVVVLPAHVEHQPRALLRALAAGVPVVASTACGLGPRAGLTEIRAGDAEGLRAALLDCLGPRVTTSS